MEELTPKTNGDDEYEKASSSNDASPLISEEASVEVNIEAEIRRYSWERRRIQKVPEFLRRVEHNKSEYDPVAVSFGPYHHGKPELKFVEDFKPKSLELFVAGSGKDTDFFYNKVVEVIHRVRRCYVENSTDEYDDDVFARMMLQDACLLIIVMDLCGNDQSKIWEVMISHIGWLVLVLIGRDMTLLENQIPLWFLKLLIHLKFGQDVGKEKLRLFLNFSLNNGVFEQTKQSNEEEEEEEEPLHILEACRRILVSDSSKDVKTSRSSIFEWLSSQSAKIAKACLRHCFSKFQWLQKREKINRGYDFKKYVHSFRSVTDLKAKGIHFKPSPTDSLKDIKFKSSYLYGKLQLPTCVVARTTKAEFLNMVAFETCPNNNYRDLTVSAYINFMKSLIISSEDVKSSGKRRQYLTCLGATKKFYKCLRRSILMGWMTLACFTR